MANNRENYLSIHGGFGFGPDGREFNDTDLFDNFGNIPTEALIKYHNLIEEEFERRGMYQYAGRWVLPEMPKD